MKSRSIRQALIFALALIQIVFPLTSTAFAHSSKTALVDTVTGTVEGFVFDPSEQPIAGARVRITNIETGNFRTTITGPNGQYQFTLLPLGRYTVEAFKDGYLVAEPNRPAIKIQLNKKVEYAPPITLIPAAQAQAAAPQPTPPTPAPPVAKTPTEETDISGRLTNQEDGTRRSNLDEQPVSLLPLSNVRTFDELAFLAAGVAPPPQVRGVAGPGIGAGIGTPGQFSVNGQRARSNNFTVDGSDNNDEDVGVRRQGFVALVPQSIESIKEVQIVTHLWDAEQGRSMGSQVNAVSKSGTNQIHGAAYDFFNHSGLNARNFFDYSDDKNKTYPLTAERVNYVDGYVNGQPIGLRTVPVQWASGNNRTPIILDNPSGGKDRYQRNQGGGVIGFPIIRDKTFFFGSFERQDIKARQETHFSVPTISQRGFLNRGATGFSVPDRNGINRIFSPTFIAGDGIWSLFPFPNNPIGPYGANTYTSILPADASGSIFSLKVDHNFKLFGPDITHAFTARYNFTDDERQIPSVGGAIFSGILPQVRTNNLSVFLNTQISPSKANQIRASYGRTALRFREIRDPFLSPTVTPELKNENFLLNAPFVANVSDGLNSTRDIATYRQTGLPSEGQLSILGQVLVNPYSPVGTDTYLFPQARANNTIQLADTFSLFRAEHSIKFGADIRRTQLNSFLNRNFRSQVVFGGSPDLDTGLVAAAPIAGFSKQGPTPGYFSGSDLASLGIPTSIFQSLAIGNADSTLGLRLWQLNFFVNDNWRVRRGLTLDYGLRYELNTVPRDVNSRIEDTFGLKQLAPSDPGISVYTDDPRFRLDPNDPTSPFPEPINRLAAINSLNATMAALQTQLGGRDSIFDSDRNNFGGHVGFAWDPFANNRNQAGKTSIRGGAGVYYDLTLGSVVSQSRNVFPNFLPINADATTFDYAQSRYFIPGDPTGVQAILNPRFIPIFYGQNGGVRDAKLIQAQGLNLLDAPSGALTQVLGLIFDPTIAGGLTSGGGIAFTLPDRRLRSPYSLQYNLQIEREVYRDLLVNLGYVGSRGIKLTRFRTPNGGPNSITIPIDPLGINANQPRLAFAFPALSDINSQTPTRPNPFLGAYSIFDSSAASSYNSFQVTATKRFSQGYQFGFAYTLAHAIDDVSDVFDVAGAYTLPQDDRNLRAERGSANFDIRHRTAISSIGDLPYISRYNDKKGTKGLLLGGWQYAMLMSYQTGQPFTVNTTYDVNFDGNYTDRIDTLNGLTMIDSRGQKLALNTNPLSLLAAQQTNGRIGRNTFRASGVARTDLSFVKNFGVREGQSVVFRVEAFNLFNRTHFGVPVRVLEAPSFGRSVDTTVAPRQIQFALKYVF